MTDLSDEARRLLDGANQAHLATLMPDGSPHSVPLWVALEGDRIAFLTSPGSRKARNIARDPRVALSVTGRDQPNTSALVRGRVVERVDGDRAWAIIDRMAYAYIGMPYQPRTDRVVFLVEPDHVLTISF
ncbi:PPOX class F420-dependent oxidoreductase [Jiangella asiatica]|uniref:PPOX class F420-dependent oxidoreductase n=1 Tax=Jiangella asiatica TaxID=2530372 RepID=A0A4R5CF46_9ACTN|nr:PPOX class F420-dependent oxidoreductase [Jiangella asiatica]TDD98205.1 PPOX class F420-dependent oxidoreductase [Jiangella asiatica]